MMPAFLARRAARAARDRANAANRAHRWADAIPDYRRYLAWRPADFAIWVQLGHMLAESGDHNGADRAYATAESLSPNDADLFLCWGHLRRRIGDVEGAAQRYRRSVEINSNADASSCLASLQSESKKQYLQEAPAPRALVGRVEHHYAAKVAGWALAADGVERDEIEFRRNGEIIGRAALTKRHKSGSYGFRTLLDIQGHDNEIGAIVSAYRRSDGAELDGSPFATPALPKPGSPPAPAWSVPLEIVKPFVMPGADTRREVALFVTHSATGLLKPHVLSYLKALAAEQIAILFIAVVDHPITLPDELLDLVAGAVVRGNRGYDFAAWAHVLKVYPELYGASTLYFANDSMFVSAEGDRFKDLIARVRASGADFIGLTESREYGPHIQSYFFAARQRLIANLQFQIFFEDVQLLEDKDAVIQTYEIPLTATIRWVGFNVDVLYPLPIAINPTLFGWDALLRAGFPFIKLLLLRGAYPEIDLRGARETLAAASFDLPLLDMTVQACREFLPQGPQPGLVDRTRANATTVEPLKVAFFGPWNYDSGLAAASRGLIGALRRTGARLNLHPIRKEFHIHRPNAPPVDIVDFVGPADIAVVHLNPDSWHLLTEDQITLIRQARRRIGYWVWEMDHLPDGWRAEFGSVDRIWAPSRYCADVFARHADVPVDVIPHAVPVLPKADIDRDAVLDEIGIDRDRRIILYVFDGSSYLVRKNPAGLARAFAASGLAARGWTLVLKTKYLMDHPTDGAAFQQLADSIEGVVLVDRSLPAAALRALIGIADVYASPHCSEGFGLTIAEAMAAGCAVIATDFGGSRDFLDESCGYPVLARPWTLEEDYHHYMLGGRWARIDEPALAATLIRAAEAVEAGDTGIRTAARARIAEQLSFGAVGALIAQSFTEVVDAVPAPSRQPMDGPRLELSIYTGMPLDLADFGPRFTILPLARDGSAHPDAEMREPADRDHWVIIAPDGALLHPLAGTAIDRHARHRPDVSIFYADDIAARTDRAFDQIRLKPAFDLTLLAAQDYIGAPLIVRASTLHTIGGPRPEAGTAAATDLLLRAHQAGLSIERLPEVLLMHPEHRVIATKEDRRRVLSQCGAFTDYDIGQGRVPDTLTLHRRFGKASQPHVTLLIPTCCSAPDGGGTPYIGKLLEQIATTVWPMERLEVIVGDDVPGTPDWATHDWPFRLRRIETARPAGAPFSYAAKMNQLWRAADSEHLVLLNDDVRPLHAGWLEALMTFAMDEGVGGVGARLLFEDGRLQHAGIVPHTRAIVHAWLFRWPELGSYQGWADVHREWSMITGAVFATRRSVMTEVNGFDEQFALEYNDVDLCLRIRALGYRLIVNPEAEMIHIEKASRGAEAPQGVEIARFLTRWRAWLEADPAWHPKLRLDTYDLLPRDDTEAWYRE